MLQETELSLWGRTLKRTRFLSRLTKDGEKSELSQNEIPKLVLKTKLWKLNSVKDIPCAQNVKLQQKSGSDKLRCSWHDNKNAGVRDKSPAEVRKKRGNKTW